MKLDLPIKLTILTFFITLCTLNFSYQVQAFELTTVQLKEAAVTKYNQGVDLSKQGNLPHAIELFREALALDPTLVDAYYNLGSLYEYLKQEDNALEAFQQALKQNPGDNEIAYKIASIYLNKAEKYSNQINSEKLNNETQALKKKIVQKTSQANSLKKSSKNSAPITYKEFQGPTGVARDSKNNIYVANYASNSIIQISSTGKRSVLIKNSPISGPIGLAVDSHDNIYVANYLSSDVIKITPQKKISSILKGIKKPYYLYIDDSDILYISEQGTNTIIKVNLPH